MVTQYSATKYSILASKAMYNLARDRRKAEQIFKVSEFRSKLGDQKTIDTTQRLAKEEVKFRKKVKATTKLLDERRAWWKADPDTPQPAQCDEVSQWTVDSRDWQSTPGEDAWKGETGATSSSWQNEEAQALKSQEWQPGDGIYWGTEASTTTNNNTWPSDHDHDEKPHHHQATSQTVEWQGTWEDEGEEEEEAGSTLPTKSQTNDAPDIQGPTTWGRPANGTTILTDADESFLDSNEVDDDDRGYRDDFDSDDSCYYHSDESDAHLLFEGGHDASPIGSGISLDTEEEAIADSGPGVLAHAWCKWQDHDDDPAPALPIKDKLALDNLNDGSSNPLSVSPASGTPDDQDFMKLAALLLDQEWTEFVEQWSARNDRIRKIQHQRGNAWFEHRRLRPTEVREAEEYQQAHQISGYAIYGGSTLSSVSVSTNLRVTDGNLQCRCQNTNGGEREQSNHSDVSDVHQKCPWIQRMMARQRSLSTLEILPR